MSQHYNHDDIELATSSPLHSQSSYGSDDLSESSGESIYSEESVRDYRPKALITDFIDSFKPFDYSILPPIYQVETKNPQRDDEEANLVQSTSFTSQKSTTLHPSHPQFDYSRFTELERAALVTATSPLSKHLKTRHLSLISLGAAIGSGLFIASSQSLSHAGPLGLLLVWFIIGVITFMTMSSLSELATAFPVSGAFVTFTTLFIDSSFGFAIAWNYAIQWLVTLPLELVAASMCIQYWDASINPCVWVTIFYITIVIINLFGVRGYGEAESLFSIIKIVAVIGFNILSIIIVAGGVPGQPYIGGKYWHKPEGGLFNTVEPFKQCCYIIANASFAYAGTEIFALAAVESKSPKKSINRARLQIFYRIFVFYFVSIVMIGLLVPYTSPALIGENSKANNLGIDINTSPFVIAIKNANIRALPSIMNAVIIITVFSVGNASVYGSSRTMCAMGALRQAPPIFNYIDRKGRPMVALGVQFIFGLLAYLVALPGPTATMDVFTWFLSLSGLSILFTYVAINISHIRFRAALDHQARIPKDELVYCSSPIYSWISLIGLITLLGLQFWAALFPPGQQGADFVGFLKYYLNLIVLVACYVSHKFYNWWFNGVPLTKFFLRAGEIDVDTGRRDIDLEIIKQEIAEEKLNLKSKPFYYKVYKFFC
ncbi:general amino acid permease [Scheffersomyces amazonensis]|uniref:general amino acid permease n=1 Tax=Scheffersomyces amazonensis TaxID=1078765 RepID=UPI00315CC7C2